MVSRAILNLGSKEEFPSSTGAIIIAVVVVAVVAVVVVVATVVVVVVVVVVHKMWHFPSGMIVLRRRETADAEAS